MIREKSLQKFFLFALSLIFTVICLVFSGCSYAGRGRIQVYRENPHYWEYNRKPVLLLGGSDEDNLFNNPELMEKNIEILAGTGGNYIRCTLSCRDEGNVWPYVTRNDRYDLDAFNPEFWNRLEKCIREAEARDIIVQIEIWATFDYYRNEWLANPFNPANNKNYSSKNTRLEHKWNHHPASRVQPFFYSLPGLNNDKILLRYQEAFVNKVLDVTLPYSNVLYCLDNETRAPIEWILYWGEFIQNEAKKRGKTIQLTEMWNEWNILAEEHAFTYKHPEFFSYTDISQNNWKHGQAHYDQLIKYRTNLTVQKGGVRPMNNVKVYGQGRGGKPDVVASVDRWWQNVFAGCASTRFHRPPTHGIGLNEKAQEIIRAARVFTSAFNIFDCEPQPGLLSARENNEAYCLADPGKAYAVYFPNGGGVNIEVHGKDNDYRMQWFDPDTFTFSDKKSTSIKYSDTSEGDRRLIILKTPTPGKTWLALIKDR